MRRIGIILSIAVLPVVSFRFQTPTNRRPAFDVASVKLHNPDGSDTVMKNTPEGIAYL